MLKVADLAAPRLDEAAANHETYRLILRQCYEVVGGANGRRLFQALFAVPASCSGRPVYKQAHAVSYVHAKLVRGGFLVCRLPPTFAVLLISWGHARPRELPKPKPKPKPHPPARARLVHLLGRS